MITEHLLYPGETVNLSDPVARKVEIFRGGEFFMCFGFYFLREKDVENGLLFRVTRHAGISMFDPSLEQFTAIVTYPNPTIKKEFYYDKSRSIFKRKIKKRKIETDPLLQ